MSIAKSFRDLNVYKVAREAASLVFQITKTFPSDERFSLSDQIRRSSRSTKSAIPEAWVRRRYRAAFVNKLDEALGEAMETQSWLDDALDCGYIAEAQFRMLDAKYNSIGAMLNAMINRADDFCKHPSDYDSRATHSRPIE